MSAANFDLSRLIAPTNSAASPGFEAKAGDPTGDLRLRLALRGWTRPSDLAEAKKIEPILASLSGEVETAATSRPGQWFLSVASRKLALAGADQKAVRDALQVCSPADNEDPVRLAFLQWAKREVPPTGMLPDEQIPAFINVVDWLGPQWQGPFGATELAAEAARRRHDGDIARMTEYPLIGETHRAALEKLLEFSLRQADGRVGAIYVHGGGGAGKTTVLAFLQRQLGERLPPATALRLDFDDAAIDPARMVTLNLALVDQLASAVPEQRSWAADAGSMLRRLAATQRSADASRMNVQKMAVQEEMSRSRGASDESSIVWNMLAPERIPRPVVLILDTAELVLAHSDRIAAGVADWIAFLTTEGGASDLRLVIAGRDPPPAGDEGSHAVRNLLDRLAENGAHFEPPIALAELDPDEAAELLRNSGLEDEAMIAAAVGAVPGNPLLLRITADALRRGDIEMQEAVQQAHAQSQVDPASASNYLMRRIVAHVADPVARPYVLASLYLPVLTREVLEAAVIPAVDRTHGTSSDAAELKRTASRVFAAFTGTYWLTRPTLDTRYVPFNRELRAFALQLLAALPEAPTLERDVRQLAAIHHLRKRSGHDKAMAFYHLAMLGLPLPRPRDRGALVGHLRDVLEEMPSAVRAWLEPVEQEEPTRVPEKAPSNPATHPSMSDSDWLLYLEGDGKREGEGDQLVRADKAADALQLYSDRPTRTPGRPPTFVVRALAEQGDWNSKLIDPGALEDEAEAAGPSDRLYWLTRLALLRGKGRLSDRFIDVLTRACESAQGPALAELPSLVVVAELTSNRTIMPERMRRAVAKSGVNARPFLVPVFAEKSLKLSLKADQVVVIQSDWYARVANVARQTHGIDMAGRNNWVFGVASKAMLQLDGEPLAAINDFYHRLDDQIEIVLDQLELQSRILLLRGQTPEFHRPLRQALLTVCGDGYVGPKTKAICDRVLDAMSIRPAEMRKDTFYERLAGNPSVWSAALIGYADQCRLLPLLAERIGEVAGNTKSKQIATSYAAWDAALSVGRSSLWRHETFDQPNRPA